MKGLDLISDAYLTLKENAGSWESIRALFPGGQIPIQAPWGEVIIGGSICYLVDAARLSQKQRLALALRLIEIYGGHPSSIETAIDQVERGVPIAIEHQERVTFGPATMAMIEAERKADEEFFYATMPAEPQEVEA